MKLFGFWTELPNVFCRTLPKMSEKLLQQTSNLQLLCQSISEIEKSIHETINLSKELVSINSEIKSTINLRLKSIEREKYFICVQSLKLSVQIMLMIIKSLDSEDYSADETLSGQISRIKVMLKLTSVIKIKVDEELNSITLIENINNSAKHEFLLAIKAFNFKTCEKLLSVSAKLLQNNTINAHDDTNYNAKLESLSASLFLGTKKRANSSTCLSLSTTMSSSELERRSAFRPDSDTLPNSLCELHLCEK